MAGAAARPTIAIAALSWASAACIYAENDDFDDPASGSGGLLAEVCDGVDNDADGLVDEHSAVNGSCGDCGLNSTDTFVYWACSTPRDYESAKLACAQFGATVQLASVGDELENGAIDQILTGDSWLGAMRLDTSWAWEDSTDFMFAPWADGSPSNDVSSDRILISVGGLWNDAPREGMFGFVCKAPAPS